MHLIQVLLQSCMSLMRHGGWCGKVYAEGRALFVAPSTRSLVRGALKYVGSGVLPGLFSME